MMKYDQLIRKAAQQHFGVCHHDHRPLERFDRITERIDRLHIEVVGRLIEEEEIGRGGDDLTEHHPAPFPSGEDFDLLVRQLTAKHHRTADRSYRCNPQLEIDTLYLLYDRIFHREPFDVSLSKVGKSRFRMVVDFTLLFGKLPCDIVEQG